ncbi:hypothetical protein IF2G_11004 [Cordyceps javanica]|nr:hypothetical protein IF2G_11004 [Cordyceps javanica]
MACNADNAKVRLLLAILNQIDLKHIDWNRVANDPVLLQPITNGHAARMRYSRLRQVIAGHKLTKRRSSGLKSSKVSKPSSPEWKPEDELGIDSTPSSPEWKLEDELGIDYDTDDQDQPTFKKRSELINTKKCITDELRRDALVD